VLPAGGAAVNDLVKDRLEVHDAETVNGGEPLGALGDGRVLEDGEEGGTKGVHDLVLKPVGAGDREDEGEGEGPKGGGAQGPKELDEGGAEVVVLLDGEVEVEDDTLLELAEGAEGEGGLDLGLVLPGGLGADLLVQPVEVGENAAKEELRVALLGKEEELVDDGGELLHVGVPDLPEHLAEEPAALGVAHGHVAQDRGHLQEVVRVPLGRGDLVAHKVHKLGAREQLLPAQTLHIRILDLGRALQQREAPGEDLQRVDILPLVFQVHDSLGSQFRQLWPAQRVKLKIEKRTKDTAMRCSSSSSQQGGKWLQPRDKSRWRKGGAKIGIFWC